MPGRTIDEYIAIKEREAEAIRKEMHELKLLIDAFRSVVSEEKKESGNSGIPGKSGKPEEENTMPWSTQELATLLPKDVINYAISLNKTPVNVFADNCGVNISTLAKWRNGECIPRGVTAQPAIVAIKAEINKPWAEKVFVTALANYERRIGR